MRSHVVRDSALTGLAWLVLVACAVNVIVANVLFASVKVDVISSLMLTLSFLAFPLVGAFIVSQRPTNTVGWLFCLAGLGTLITSFSGAYVQTSLHFHTDAQPLTGYIDLLGDVVWPCNLVLGISLLFLFPDGRALSKRWSIGSWGLLLLLLVVVVAQAVTPGPLESQNRVPNPLGIARLGSLPVNVMNDAQSLLPLFILLAIASLVLRYRRASDDVRRQIKWFVYGSAVMLVVVLGGIEVSGFISQNQNDPAVLRFTDVTFSLGILALPLGVGIGVLRYRLYDIDVIINRTLVYGSLTAILAGLYFGLVIGAQTLLRPLWGAQSADSPVVIVVSTLLVAALFQPLRAWLQREIDRRFYRSRYDAAKTVAAFSAALRQEVEISDLNAHLLDVVHETVQPAHVSLWLLPERPPEASSASRVATRTGGERP